MNRKSSLKLLVLTAALVVSTTHASTLMQYELGEITSGANLVNGTVYFVSWGADGIFQSSISSLTGSTSLISGDDKWLHANSIIDGVTMSNWSEQYSTGVAAGHKFQAVFVADLFAADIDYATGSLLNGKSIGAIGAGPTFYFGSFRTDNVETLQGNVPDPIAWTLPANVGATATIAAYSGTGGYSGYSDYNAPLNVNNGFSLVPEPSTGALMMIGAAGLVALRRLRKV
jgi:hypothetical protein